SGGQRQRVAIARGLVRGPRIALADEPTAALDKHAGREVVDLLHTLAQERSCAILLVTHDSRIIDVADRILTLEDGRLTAGSSGLATHTEYVLSALQRRGDLQRQAASLPTPDFLGLVEGFSSEVTQLARTLDTARNEVLGILVDDTVETIARKLRQIFHVERTSVYLVDRHDRVLRSKSAFHDGAGGIEVAIPIGAGPAGRAAELRQTINVQASAGGDSIEDIGAPPNFHAEAAVAAPVRTVDGQVVAVAELIN